MALNMKLLAFCLLITVLSYIQKVQGGSILTNINLGSKTISATTTYSFTLTLTTSIGDGTTMIFTVPSDITLPSIGAISCTGVTGFKKTPTCAVTTSTTIKVSFSTGTIISKYNIKNPGSAMTLSNLKVETYNSTTLLDTTSSATVTYTPITLASSAGSISTVSTQVGIYTSFSISVKIGTAVTASSKVIITFPKWEQRSLGKSTPQSMVDSITSTCTLGGDLSGTTSCSSLVSAASSGIVDTVTVTGLFATTIGLAIGKTIKITITIIRSLYKHLLICTLQTYNVRNPPTLKPYSTYEIATTDTNLNVIEQCSGLSLTMTSVGQLSSDSLVRVINTVEINALGTYLFIIKITNPLPVGGWIRVILNQQL